MKLNELAFKVNMQITHSDAEIQQTEKQILKDGKFLQSIEGNKYKLYIDEQLHPQKSSVGMFTSDDKFVGFLQYTKIDESILSLEKIFILPEFRNVKVAKIFLYWFKASMKKSVFIGGVVFDDGKNFINSLVKDPRFEDDIYGFNAKHKEKFKFDISKFFDGNQNTGMLIEMYGDFYGFYDNSWPGQPSGSNLICLEMFANEV